LIVGWQDRHYASEDAYHRVTGSRRSIIPANWNISIVILVINVVLFLLAPRGTSLFMLMVLHGESVLYGQIWRLVTACFLHWDSTHLFFNMIGLYFFGPALERLWGRKKFFWVYMLAGIIANTIFVFLYLLGWDQAKGPAAGASGCLYAILGAMAILMPQVRVLLFFIIPMKIRTALALFIVYGLYTTLTRGPNAGGEAVHLVGLAVGMGYTFWEKRHPAGLTTQKVKPPSRSGSGAWKQKLEDERNLAKQVDIVLAKVHEQGINSLNRKEKNLLADASKHQSAEEKKHGRTDQL